MQQIKKNVGLNRSAGYPREPEMPLPQRTQAQAHVSVPMAKHQRQNRPLGEKQKLPKRLSRERMELRWTSELEDGYGTIIGYLANYSLQIPPERLVLSTLKEERPRVPRLISEC